MASIEGIFARQILDSRGNPTVEVEVGLDDGSLGRAAVPSGASTGIFEAVELRDGGEAYGGKAVAKAVQGVIDEIQPELLGYDADDQRLIDQALIDLDRTPDKSRLGANAIVGVSIAVAKAAAESAQLPLFRYLGGPNAHVLPVPCLNILNGGAHADSNVDIQEFMIAPIGAATFSEALRWGAETYHALKAVLKQHGLNTGVGDEEGGFAPNLESNRAALDLILEAIRRGWPHAGRGRRARHRRRGEQLRLDGERYAFEGGAKTAAEMTQIYAQWLDAYPIVSLEDPLAEEDWAGWRELTAELGGRVQVVGDDIFVTNPDRLRRGISEKVANSLLVKVNQIGTLTETFTAVELAHRSGYTTMMSHRSGEVRGHHHRRPRRGALNCGQIQTGAPCRSERVAKVRPVCCGSRKCSATPRPTRAGTRSRASRRRLPDSDAGAGAGICRPEVCPGCAPQVHQPGGRARDRALRDRTDPGLPGPRVPGRAASDRPAAIQQRADRRQGGSAARGAARACLAAVRRAASAGQFAHVLPVADRRCDRSSTRPGAHASTGPPRPRLPWYGKLWQSVREADKPATR